ncbi:Calcium-binding EF-hand family protein [Parasponia andersonii]|uniref:Calcium-binding EF-hand family protein n=1 Tax=Parasponia andersonii TaxID=3476 RepID=A0A2P5AUR1_PARAD|nr:Calcium-binding EF-hand family protein [Parasponia andersonii]
MDGLRETAYAYYEVIDDNTKQAIKDFSEQMETKKLPNKIMFKEFSAYMKAIGFAQFSSKEFFDELRASERDHLVYADIITLLYFIQSGRPFCNHCKKFIKGTYFTCVKCFEKEGDYSFNVCPSCYRTNNYNHDHKEFLDPTVMLRLKIKQELTRQSSANDIINYNKLQPRGSNTSKSSSHHAQSSPSSSNAIVVHNPQRKTVKADRALQLMQIAVGLGNLAVATSQLCTIM